ncbi:MAG: hypothetical protein H6811_01695 [Phycisphaeraceae bacterium]|nr:hypothetical protein [Phycisphaeraceae bacterium]
MRCVTRTVVACAVVVCAGEAWAQNTLLYVFEGDEAGFDADGRLFAYIQAGLATDGNPFRQLDDRDRLLDHRGAVAADPIYMGRGRDRVLVGFRSRRARGTWIYDLSRGTMQNAYDTIAKRPGTSTPRGKLDINAHGYYAELDGIKGIGEGDRLGGGIVLDKDTYYAGFMGGTGVPKMPVYEIMAPNGRANIEATLYSCWSGVDPDGEGRGFRSVARSFDTVPGIASVQAATTSVSYTIRADWVPAGPPPRGVSSEMIKDAIDAKRGALDLTRGFDNLGSWISTLKFEERYPLLTGNFGAVPVDVGGITVQVPLHWTVSLTRSNALSPGDRGPHESNPRFDFPVGLDTSVGGPVFNSIETELSGTAWITQMRDEDEAPEIEILQLLRRGDIGRGPAGLDLISGVYELRAIDGMLEEGSAALEVTFDPSLVERIAGIYVLDERGWQPVPTRLIGRDVLMTDPIRIESLGRDGDALLFGAFGVAVPAPPGAAALGMLGLLGANRRRGV